MSDTAKPIDYGLLDRLGVDRMIFYPRRDYYPPPRGAEDLMVDVAPGEAVAARFYPGDPAWPSILYFHGNGEVACDYDDSARYYHEAQLNLFVADYRGYGASRGRPTFAAMVGDAHPVIERFHSLLDERGFGESRYVMGRSLGTHPALELAAHAPGRLKGLIIESGAGNLDRLVRMFAPGAISAEAQELMDQHRAKVEGIRLPSLTIHGSDDELIPVEAALAFHELLAMPHKELLVIPGAGHNDIFWIGLTEYFAAISAFVAACG